MDFSMAQGEDVLLILSMNPPVNVTGWSTQFQVVKRLGSTNPLITKTLASGAVSGITINNPTAGVFGISINHPDTSGFQFSPYNYNFFRFDSGSYTLLTEGVCLIQPDVGAI